jgi:hypothetical protein
MGVGLIEKKPREIIMHKSLMVCMLATLPLGGCATLNQAHLIDRARKLAVASCNFLPIAEDVAQIILVGNPLVMTDSAIATAICRAVTAPAAVRGGRAPTVHGVPVRGSFQRP